MPTPHRRSVPLSRCIDTNAAATWGPTARTSGVGCTSTTVTSSPSARALDATSAPTNPAPATTTVGQRSSSARIAAASSTVRSTNTPSGGAFHGTGRGRAPVQTTRSS